MTQKKFRMTPKGIEKMPGYYSWRHEDNRAHLAARENYKRTRGRINRQRRAKERLAAKAAQPEE